MAELGAGGAANAQQIGTGRGWARGCEVVRVLVLYVAIKINHPKVG